MKNIKKLMVLILMFSIGFSTNLEILNSSQSDTVNAATKKKVTKKKAAKKKTTKKKAAKKKTTKKKTTKKKTTKKKTTKKKTTKKKIVWHKGVPTPLKNSNYYMKSDNSKVSYIKFKDTEFSIVTDAFNYSMKDAQYSVNKKTYTIRGFFGDKRVSGSIAIKNVSTDSFTTATGNKTYYRIN